MTKKGRENQRICRLELHLRKNEVTDDLYDEGIGSDPFTFKLSYTDRSS